jgi:SAM-dependent methyltransferase
VSHHEHQAGQAQLLDLDAEVVGHLDEITAWAGGHAAHLPRAIVDVGAGTGTGALALGRRFERARLVAIDSSAEVLEHLRTAALREGLGDRVRVVRADLDAGWPDAGWPDVGGFHLGWAASSLHHLEHPGRVLGDLHAALEPAGLLVVVESDGMPRFLPHDVGVGRPGLEDRIRAAMAQDRWNAHPDWGPYLQRAGFEVLEQRTFAYERAPAPPAAHRYAHLVLSGVRSRLAERLDADDLEALDRLLAEDGTQSVLRRGDLTVRSTRTAWAARRA